MVAALGMMTLSQSTLGFFNSSVIAFKAPPMSRSLSWRGLIWATSAGPATATAAKQRRTATPTPARRNWNKDISTFLRCEMSPHPFRLSLSQQFGIGAFCFHGAFAPCFEGDAHGLLDGEPDAGDG